MVFYNPPLVVWGLWHSMKGLMPDATRSKIKFVDPGDPSELQAVVPDEVSSHDANVAGTPCTQAALLNDGGQAAGWIMRRWS
jgi:hypothetical protein